MKMKQRTEVLEEGRVPAHRENGWKIEAANKHVTREENKRRKEGFLDGGLMAHKGLWTLMDSKILEELPRQVHDEVQECMGMMEDYLLRMMQKRCGEETSLE